MLAVKGNLKYHNITRSAILLFCRIPSYPSEMFLKSCDEQIAIQYMPSSFSSGALTIGWLVAGILKCQSKIGIIHNLRGEEFLNIVALKDDLFHIACSYVSVKPADLICSWQESSTFGGCNE